MILLLKQQCVCLKIQLDGYIESILSLKEKYKDQISILVGLECEYFEKYIPWLKQMLEDEKNRLYYFRKSLL